MSESVKVGPWQYKLVERRQGHTDGECDFDTHTIFLGDGLHPARRNEVVLHESLHAIFDMLGLRDDLQGVNGFVELEESIIKRLSPALLGFMRDNTEFIRKAIR